MTKPLQTSNVRGFVQRFLSLALATLFTATLLATQAAAQPNALVPVERNPDEMMIFELVLGRGWTLTDGLFGYVTGDGVLLPLQDLLDAFELPITVDPGNGIAEGWFFAEHRRFHLDLARGEVTVEGQTTRFDPKRVELHFDAVYVEAGVFGEWFPVDLAVDLASLRVHAQVRETLPMQARLEREARWQGSRRGGAPTTWEARFEAAARPYRALDWPLFDVDLGLSVALDPTGQVRTEKRQAVVARGDFLGMTGELFVNDADRRLTLLRQDPDGGLLGFLRATDLRVGDVGSLVEPLVGGGGDMRGIEISNRMPRSAGTSSVFDRLTLEGDVLPGWEVELYRNDLLEDFQRVGDTGRYRFPDVELRTGLNLFRLVFHGPHGERRERVEKVFVSADLLSPGETRYRMGLYQQGMGLLERPPEKTSARQTDGLFEESGAPRLGLDVERGVSRSLSVAAGFSSLELGDGRHDAVRHDYVRIGLKTSFLGAAGRLRAVADARGGAAFQAGFRRRFGRLGLSVEHLENAGLESPELRPDRERGTLRSRSELRLETSFSLPRIGTVPLRFESRHTLHSQEGKTLEELNWNASTGFSVKLHGWRLNAQQSIESNTAGLRAPGELRADGRLGHWQLRGGLTWDVAPFARLNSLTLNGHRQVNENLRLSAGLSRPLTGGETSANLGVDWAFAPLRLRLDAGGSTGGDARVGVGVSFGLGRASSSGRKNGHWRMSRERRASQGTVSARVFLDLDEDGRFGPEDMPLEGVRLEVNGRRQGAPSDANGLVHVGLASYRHSDLRVAEGSLEDPFWISAVEGRGFVGRPGVAWTADFPVVLTGEVDGTVYLERDGERREAANVELELLTEDGTVAARTKSQFDGFYLFQRVRPGRYAVCVAAEQAARLGLDAAPRTVVIGGGDVAAGIDLTARAGQDGKG